MHNKRIPSTEFKNKQTLGSSRTWYRRYTKHSRKSMDTDIIGVLMGGKTRMEKDLL
jgi:hypothetical protein